MVSFPFQVFFASLPGQGRSTSFFKGVAWDRMEEGCC